MGRYSRLLDKPSLNSITTTTTTSRGENLRRTILSSFNLAQHFNNYRRKKSLEKFLDKQLFHHQSSSLEQEAEVVGVIDAALHNNTNSCAQVVVVASQEIARVFEGSNIWRSTAMAGFQEDMMNLWDLSLVKNLQTLTLSKGDVNSVAFGRNFILATGSGDKRVEICKWKKGEGFQSVEFSPLKEHKYTVSCVDWSPYGNILATASVDGTAILWDATNGEKLTSFIQPGNASVRVCQFSSRSTLLLTAGDCGNVYIWDISTRALKCTLQAHDEAVYAASFSPDENFLVSGDSTGLVVLHSWDAKKPLATVECAHDLGVTCMAFAPAIVTAEGGVGKICLMVTGGNDSQVKIWNVTLSSSSKCSIRPLRSLSGHSESVMCVRVSSGGLIASASGDKTVRLWTLSGKCVKVLEGHERYVTSCSFSVDGKLLASGDGNKKVIIWDLSGDLSIDDELQSAVGEFSLSSGEMWPQYEKLCRSKMLQEENGVILKASYEVPKVDFNSCVFDSNNAVYAGASSDRHIYGWAADGVEIDMASIVNHKYSINSLCYSKESDTLACASTDGTVNLFNTEKKIAGLYHPSGGALRVCKFSLDGNLLIAAGDDEKASLWRMKTTSIIKQFHEHEAAIYGCAFTPDSQYVVTGCVNGYLRLWDCMDDDNTSSIVSQQAHELGINSCDFSPIGLGGTHGQHRFLLGSGGNDSQVKIWYVDIKHKKATFMLCHTLSDHGTANVNCIAFSPSGKLVCSAAGDATARIWDVATGSCLHVVEGHNRYVTSCAFASCGSLLATCSSDHTVKVWQLKGTLAYDTSRSVEHMAVENLIAKWTCEDVVNWLAEIGLGDLGHVFESNEISGEKLATLTDNILVNDLSIEDEGLRTKILTEIKWLKSLGITSSKTKMSKSMTIAAPIEFFCPITHDIMIEPVTTCDGHTYERQAITEWFLTGKTTSPLTNIELDSMNLTPNFELQNRISEFLAQRLNAE